MTLSCNFKCNVLIVETVVGEMPSECSQDDCNLEGEHLEISMPLSAGQEGKGEGTV